MKGFDYKIHILLFITLFLILVNMAVMMGGCGKTDKASTKLIALPGKIIKKAPAINYSKMLGFSSYEGIAYPKFDYQLFFDILAEHKINFTRVFSTAHWASPEGNFSPFLKINGRFDLSQFNQIYFDRMRDYVNYANSEGILVQVSIFISQDLNPWKNNANGIAIKDEIDWYEPSSSLETYQRIYAVKVVETLRRCAVIFEVMNEGKNKKWHNKVIGWFKEAGAGKISVNLHPPNENDISAFDVDYAAFHIKEWQDVMEFSMNYPKSIFSDDGGRPYSIENQFLMAREALLRGASFEHQSEIENDSQWNVLKLKDPSWWEYHLLKKLATLR